MKKKPKVGDFVRLTNQEDFRVYRHESEVLVVASGELTERQAWLRLAKNCDLGGYAATGGICSALHSLWSHGVISYNTHYRMTKKAQKWADKSKDRWCAGSHCGNFAAPLTDDGAKLRAAFCRRQAALLAKRKVAK